jgi:phage gp36-like protein
MPYCTKEDIIKLISEETLIELSDDFGAGIVDDATVDKAIADADAEIDGYCNSRYTVPFVPVPVVIAKISQDITAYNLHSRRPGMPEARQKRYEAAIKLLTNLSKGLVTLGAAAEESASGDKVQVSAQDRVFTRETLKGY